MNKWKVNWSGAIQAFPGLESLISNFTDLAQHAKEQVAHIEQSVLAYFQQHQGSNGSLAIDASADPHGEHSATVTLAAVPKVTEVPVEGEHIEEPPVDISVSEKRDGSQTDSSSLAESHSDNPIGNFVIQAQGNGLSLVFGPTTDQVFHTPESAEAALSAVVDARLGDSPIKTVVQVTEDQVQALVIEGLPTSF